MEEGDDRAEQRGKKVVQSERPRRRHEERRRNRSSRADVSPQPEQRLAQAGGVPATLEEGISVPSVVEGSTPTKTHRSGRGFLERRRERLASRRRASAPRSAQEPGLHSPHAPQATVDTEYCQQNGLGHDEGKAQTDVPAAGGRSQRRQRRGSVRRHRHEGLYDATQASNAGENGPTTGFVLPIAGDDPSGFGGASMPVDYTAHEQGNGQSNHEPTSQLPGTACDQQHRSLQSMSQEAEQGPAQFPQRRSGRRGRGMGRGRQRGIADPNAAAAVGATAWPDGPPGLDAQVGTLGEQPRQSTYGRRGRRGRYRQGSSMQYDAGGHEHERGHHMSQNTVPSIEDAGNNPPQIIGAPAPEAGGWEPVGSSAGEELHSGVPAAAQELASGIPEGALPPRRRRGGRGRPRGSRHVAREVAPENVTLVL